MHRVPELGSWGDDCSQWKAPPLESAVKGGARVTVNMMVRDMDLPVPNARDARRLKIVADGLPLFGGVQLAVDTTLVSPLHRDGSPHRDAANIDGTVLEVARHKQETTYPELTGPNACCRLVVLAGETGGCWSEETRTFVGLLVKAKGREVPWVLTKRVEQARCFRWGSLLACASARTFATPLLDVRVSRGADGTVPNVTRSFMTPDTLWFRESGHVHL